MQQRPKDDFQTDALRPAALPTASLKPRVGAGGVGGGGIGGGNTSLEEQLDQSSEAYLDSVYEDWNKKVDVEVETLVEGMVELVNISSIGNKDKFRVAQEAFEAQCRTESMVRAATSLLSITHSIKLLFLLSDEQQIASRRDQAAEMFKQKTDHERASAAHTLDSLLTKGGGGK